MLLWPEWGAFCPRTRPHGGAFWRQVPPTGATEAFLSHTKMPLWPEWGAFVARMRPHGGAFWCRMLLSVAMHAFSKSFRATQECIFSPSAVHFASERAPMGAHSGDECPFTGATEAFLSHTKMHLWPEWGAFVARMRPHGGAFWCQMTLSVATATQAF